MDMAVGRHLPVTDVTIDTGLQAAFLRAGETHTRASHKRAGRQDTAPVASKSLPLINDADFARPFILMVLRQSSFCFVVDLHPQIPIKRH